jgi:hypothetical protein
MAFGVSKVKGKTRSFAGSQTNDPKLLTLKAKMDLVSEGGCAGDDSSIKTVGVRGGVWNVKGE